MYDSGRQSGDTLGVSYIWRVADAVTKSKCAKTGRPSTDGLC